MSALSYKSISPLCLNYLLSGCPPGCWNKWGCTIIKIWLDESCLQAKCMAYANVKPQLSRIYSPYHIQSLNADKSICNHFMYSLSHTMLWILSLQVIILLCLYFKRALGISLVPILYPHSFAQSNVYCWHAKYCCCSYHWDIWICVHPSEPQCTSNCVSYTPSIRSKPVAHLGFSAADEFISYVSYILNSLKSACSSCCLWQSCSLKTLLQRSSGEKSLLFVMGNLKAT